MRTDSLNWYSYGGYTKMTALSLNVFSTDEDESDGIIIHKTLSKSCSANKNKSKQSIINKTLPQNYSADVDKLSSMEEDK